MNEINSIVHDNEVQWINIKSFSDNAMNLKTGNLWSPFPTIQDRKNMKSSNVHWSSFLGKVTINSWINELWYLGFTDRNFTEDQAKQGLTRMGENPGLLINEIDNWYQLMMIDWLILEIDYQSMAKRFVIFNCHRLLLIAVDQLDKYRKGRSVIIYWWWCRVINGNR